MTTQAEAGVQQGPETYVLVGPTAVGKSAVAQRLAESMGAWVLSADSMMVYTGMDIGTAKPSGAERSRVRYWGVDVVTPDSTFDLAAYMVQAGQAATECARTGCPLLVVGGTGLYVRALVQGLDSLPPTDPAHREAWERLYAAEGIEALRRALDERCPSWLSALDDSWNPRRLIRALELTDAGVTSPPDSWSAGVKQPVLAGLRLNAASLNSAIESRVHDMYRKGLLDEAKGLRERCGELSRTASQAIGYAEAFDCLDGRCSIDEAMARTMVRTRRLAKRQMTWFRHQANVEWVDAQTGAAADEAIRTVWKRCGPIRLALTVKHPQAIHRT